MGDTFYLWHTHIWRVVVVIGIIFIFLGMPGVIKPGLLPPPEFMDDPLNFVNVTEAHPILWWGIVFLAIGLFILRGIRWQEVRLCMK